jgi:hypothetical protein
MAVDGNRFGDGEESSVIACIEAVDLTAAAALGQGSGEGAAWSAFRGAIGIPIASGVRDKYPLELCVSWR